MKLSVLFYKIEYNYLRVKAIIFYRLLFRKFGNGSVLYRPTLLLNTEQASIGKRTIIRKGLRMEVLTRPDNAKASIEIGDNTNIEQNCHIICQNSVVIGSNVSITANCAVVDTTHPYEDNRNNEKYGERIAFNNDKVIIGDNVFVGYNSIILPGTSIGKNSFVGAMSVVKGVFPDGALIYGSPARVVKIIK